VGSTNNFADITTASIRAIAASFPIASSLAAGWSEYKNFKQAENIQDILTEFAKRISVIENAIDKEFLKSDEMKKLIEQATIKGKDEIIQERRYFYSEFLKNATTKSCSVDKEKDMVLETISKVSVLHVSILNFIASALVVTGKKEDVLLGSEYNHNDENKPTFKYQYEKTIIDIFSGIEDITEKENNVFNIEASLDYLLSIGVVELHSHRGWTRVGEKQGVRGFRPTKLGLKVLEYLGKNIETIDKSIFLN